MNLVYRCFSSVLDKLTHWWSLVSHSQILIWVDSVLIIYKLTSLLLSIWTIMGCFYIFFTLSDGSQCWLNLNWITMLVLSDFSVICFISLILIPVWILTITKDTNMLLKLFNLSVEDTDFMSLWLSLFDNILEVFVSNLIFITLAFNITLKLLVWFSSFNV